MKFINLRFILNATLTFIPYTALWFFWHNNIMHKVYYTAASVYSMADQNIWAMNFANALFVYGFVYFYYRAVKPETKLIHAVLWSIYYNISVIGFFAFMNFGMMKEWDSFILFHELIWAVIGGIIMGVLCYLLYNKFKLRQ